MVPLRARMIVTGTVAALAVTLAGPLMPRAAASGDHSAPAASRSQAAGLIHARAAAVRTDSRANIRAGAALLASYAGELGSGGLPANVNGWYAAVARYSGATDRLVAQEFADDVFATLRSGAARSTSDGQSLRLAAQPGVRPDRSQLGALRLRATPAVTPAECPAGLDCRYIPAAYAQNDPADPSDYGNYDIANRPARPNIRYIVIHDTEALYRSSARLVRYLAAGATSARPGTHHRSRRGTRPDRQLRGRDALGSWSLLGLGPLHEADRRTAAPQRRLAIQRGDDRSEVRHQRAAGHGLRQ